MIQLVLKYQEYIENLRGYIDESPYKSSFFLKELNLSKPTFYRKLREQTFTVDEVSKLTKLLFPKEAYKQEFLESIKEGKEDVVLGNIKTSKEIRQSMREKIEAYQNGNL